MPTEGKVPSRRRVRGVFVAAIVVIVALISFEFFGNVAYRLESGLWLYDRKGRDSAVMAVAGGQSAQRTLIHPFFGFMYTFPSEMLGGNTIPDRLGFLNLAAYCSDHQGSCDYPSAGQESNFVIGIFGNSVAGGLALVEQKTQTLSAILQRSSQLRGRKAVVLNFASGAYNIEQSLIVLNYLWTIGQRLDLIVFLDNTETFDKMLELAGQGLDPTTPHVYLNLVDNLDTLSSGSSEGLLEAYHRTAAQRERRDAATCLFGLCYLAHRAMQDFHDYRARQLAPPAIATGEKQDCTWRKPDCNPNSYYVRPKSFSDQLPMDQALDIWRRAILGMNAVARNFPARVVYVQMPSPWTRPQDDFRPEIGHRQSIRAHVLEVQKLQSGYARQLGESGVVMIDQAKSLDGTDLSAYQDDLHPSESGYVEVLRGIGEKLSASPAAFSKSAARP